MSTPVLAFKCEKCGKELETEKGLALHNVQLHSGKDHICRYCGDKFSVKAGLFHHERKCVNRDQETREYYIRQHILKLQRVPKKATKIVKVCEFCQAPFTRITSYKEHVNSCSRNYIKEFRGKIRDYGNSKEIEAYDLNDPGLVLYNSLV